MAQGRRGLAELIDYLHIRDAGERVNARLLCGFACTGDREHVTWILHQKPGIVLDHQSKVRRRHKRERSIQHSTRRLSENHDREAPVKVKFSSAMIKLLASWAKKMAGKLRDDLTGPQLSASLASEFQRHVKK